MKIAFSIFFISFLNISLIAQDTILEKSPKQFSFEAGYRRNISSGFTNKADNGFNLAAEVAWKVSGFHKKSAVYFGVPLGYNYAMANSDIDNNTSTLFYGWIVRHEFGRDKKITPFAGYGLLLNQFRINETDGSVFGHQTRFEFGVNKHLKKKSYLFAKIEYSFARFPSLGNSSSNKVHFVEIKVGIRI